MKSLSPLILATLIASKKLKPLQRYDTIQVVGGEDDKFPTPEVIFDLTGMVRRYFALDALGFDSGKNIICSPLSALLPLGKLALGTEKGKSRDELLNAIGSTRFNVQGDTKELMNTISDVSGVAMTVISRIFVSTTLKLSKEYLKTTRQLYGSSVQRLDFTKSIESIKHVNDWVNNQTRGMIQNILKVQDITPSTSILLVNAVYFLGYWKYPFDVPFVGSFYSPRGVKNTLLMKTRNHFSYYQSGALDAQIIVIPYKSEKASFVIVLPLSKTGLPNLITALRSNPDLLNIEMAKMTPQFIEVTMPKFKITTELNLKLLLQKIGVTKIFTKESGLVKIAERPLSVSYGVQRAVIDVTEKGTEGSASTVIYMQQVSLLDHTTKFIADRPFLFYVKVAGEQLFAGIFNNN
ncbi:hypothetical protein ACJJTC_004168 [Scirpophaga incertulas]